MDSESGLSGEDEDSIISDKALKIAERISKHMDYKKVKLG